ncbi:MAG: DNA-processing protein DprA, partial [Spongiibacteraceae bacterium]|nr:DNA-processing protein DprA [Spongiibacteraceae bacterium]
MTSDSDFLWLLLQHLPGATPATVRRLLAAAEQAGWPQGEEAIGDWLGRTPAALAAAGVPPALVAGIAGWQRAGRSHPAALQASADGRWLTLHGARLLVLPSSAYPALLREIPDPPIWLQVRGDVAALMAPQLAVVGSRRATRQGMDTAARFAGALAAAGCVITSGLAYGIDASAHRAALTEGGRTVAVLGTGLDRIYPARHAELAEAVAAQGALVSELPLGSPPRAGHFPRRNRIISGLSLGVLVVEAAPRSGSLVTARLALGQNREVFAVPGSIHNPASRGCNELIRQGAVLVQEIADILQ